MKGVLLPSEKHLEMMKMVRTSGEYLTGIVTETIALERASQSSKHFSLPTQ